MRYKSKNIVVINKPAGIPTQPDTSGDKDALTITGERLSECGEASELWLVHRLDRVVGGLVAFARTHESADEFSRLVQSDDIHKEYLAVVENAAGSGEMVDYLYKDSRSSKAFVVKGERRGAKKARLEYETLLTINSERGMRSLVRIRLYTGRFHQIRAQFSSRGMSIVGDGKYGNRDNKAKMPALFAYRLTFKTRSESVDVTAMPDVNTYPWSLFDMENLI